MYSSRHCGHAPSLQPQHAAQVNAAWKPGTTQEIMDINHKLITYVLLWWTLNQKVALCRITAELHWEAFHEWTWPCKGIEQKSLFFCLFCYWPQYVWFTTTDHTSSGG
ncbi:uncharacterized [Tachysurus ichikawai]